MEPVFKALSDQTRRELLDELFRRDGQTLNAASPRLVQSYRAVWDDDIAAEGTSRVTWDIEPAGGSCRLTVIHDQLREDADPHLYGGWPMILSGLKTWLDTGQELAGPGYQYGRQCAGLQAGGEGGRT